MSNAGGDLVFGSRDACAEYGGKGFEGSGKNGPKGKPVNQISANFQTPMVPKSSFKGSASDSDTRQSVKGEKSKKKVVTPPSTLAAAGAVGGGESSRDDNDAGFCIPKSKLGDLCRHLGNGRGECYIVLCYCVIELFWCRCELLQALYGSLLLIGE